MLFSWERLMYFLKNIARCVCHFRMSWFRWVCMCFQWTGCWSNKQEITYRNVLVVTSKCEGDKNVHRKYGLSSGHFIANIVSLISYKSNHLNMLWKFFGFSRILKKYLKLMWWLWVESCRKVHSTTYVFQSKTLQSVEN